MISHTYKNMGPTDLEAFGALVISRLSNNTLFNAVKASILLDFELAQNAFAVAKTAASSGGSDRIEIRETCKKDLVNQLYFTSIKVEDLAKGDSDVIEAAGFVLRKAKAKRTKKEPIAVVTPIGLSAINVKTKPGFIYLAWSEVAGVLNYAVEFRIKGETVWKNGTYTTHEFVELSGFASDTIVEFRIRALGEGEDKSDWTSVVKILVN